MGIFDRAAFIDKASPQQLDAMVKAKDPYSPLALARLQEIRDEAMGKKARQPKAPPLVDSIPTQANQAVADRDMNSLQGIRAAAPMQAPAMPPMAPPMAPQQPPQPQPQQQPVMARAGGLMAFKHGGMAHFSAAGSVRDQMDGSLMPEAEDPNAMPSQMTHAYPGTASGAGMGFTPADTQAMASMNDAERAAYAQSRIAQNAGNVWANAKPDPNNAERRYVMPGSPPRTQAEWMGMFTPAAAPAAAPAAPAVPPSGIQTVVPQTGAMPEVPPAGNKPAAATGSTGAAGLGSLQGVQNVYNRLSGRLAEQQGMNQNYADEMKALLNKEPGTLQGLREAQGNRGADRAAALRDLNAEFPDPFKEQQAMVQQLQENNAKQDKNSRYHPMLETAFALMGDTSGNLFTALGKAGGVGLRSYKEAEKLREDRDMKLMDMKGRLAVAQDARSRGMYDVADRQAELARADRIQAFDFSVQSNVRQTQAAIQAAGLKHGLQREEIADLQHEFGNRVSIWSNLAQLNKPSAEVAVYDAIKKDPDGFGKWYGSQKNARIVAESIPRLAGEYATHVAKLVAAGVSPDKIPEEGQWMSETLVKMRNTLENYNVQRPGPK